ncbi:DUF4998 domain-containing protein [Draconibacterium sediminis]|nr:DUF4998 domain-containing protein [Draconibacterium sediminis]
MKDNKILHIAILFALIFGFSQCSDMNELHEQYLQGERIYIGRPDSVVIGSGNNKVKINWWLNADPNLAETVIYWNQKNDSLVVPINEETEMSVFINNLEEATHIFEVVNKNESGLASIPIERSAIVYGAKYIDGLLNRGIAKIDGFTDKVVLTWSTAAAEIIDTKLEYTNNENQQVSLIVAPETMETEITDFVPGGEFHISTSYRPDENAIENFYSNSETYNFSNDLMLYGSNMSDMDLPFDLTGQCWGGDISKLFDYSLGGYYHNSCGGEYDGKVHHFTIDLGVEVELSKIKLYPRQDCCQNRNWKEFQLFGILNIEEAETTVVPDDPNWETEMLSKGWINLLNCTDGKTTDESWKGSASPLTMEVEDQSRVRFIRFRVLNTWDENTVETALTEILFYASKVY